MNEHKTPEQIAREELAGVSTEVYFGRSITDWMVAAIDADRAQRSEPTGARGLYEAWAKYLKGHMLQTNPAMGVGADFEAGYLAALRTANNVQEES